MVSVIVPIYNAEKTLDRCIASILEQSYADYELICVDDGSTDNSPAICNSYDDTRIKVLSQPHRGVSAARNHGLSESTGDYVAFCDADDYLSPNFLRKMTSIANAMDSDITICGHYVVSAGGITDECEAESKYISSAHIAKSLMMGYEIGGFCWNKLFRRSVIADTSFPVELTHMEDTYFLFMALSITTRIYYLAECLYYYCNDDSEHSATNDIRRLIGKDNKSAYAVAIDKILQDFSVTEDVRRYLKIVKFRTSLGIRRRYKRIKEGDKTVLHNLNRELLETAGSYYLSPDIAILEKLVSFIKLI